MDKISFPYRAASHLVLLHVISESGSWEKHGLDVDYDKRISASEAHRAIPAGDVEFVGGNHVSTYGHRARGDSWVYLGQTLNMVHTKLITRQETDIFKPADLKGKKVGTRGSHPGLNDWLQLKKRGFDVDRGDVELINQLVHKKGSMDAEGENDPKTKGPPPLWTWVRDGVVDAAFVTPPSSLFAEEAGLRVIDIDPLPMIWFTTISTSLEFAAAHPDIVNRFLKGIIEGIHFFKTQPEASIKIIQKRYTKEGQLSEAQARYTYENLAPLLEPKLYPSMAAIANVYEEAKRQDADAAKVNPLALWDLHHVRSVDDSGFVDQLYSDARAKKKPMTPDDVEELADKRTRMIAEIKACGHPEGEACACG